MERAGGREGRRGKQREFYNVVQKEGSAGGRRERPLFLHRPKLPAMIVS